jgi:hypothetical protein
VIVELNFPLGFVINRKNFNQVRELSCRFEQLCRFAFFGKVNGMDSEIYHRTSVRGRRFVFQVLNIHFLTEETEHDERLHHALGLYPARPSSAAARLPSDADVPASRALSAATATGTLFQSATGLSSADMPAARALFQSTATGTLPSTAAASRLRLPTGAL